MTKWQCLNPDCQSISFASYQALVKHCTSSKKRKKSCLLMIRGSLFQQTEVYSGKNVPNNSDNMQMNNPFDGSMTLSDSEQMKKKAKISNGNNENSEVTTENDIAEEDIFQSENINTEEINDGSVRITEEEIDELLYNKSNLKLPPRQEFLYALYGILNHPSIPRYIYSCVVKFINKMLNSPNKELFMDYIFNTSREFVEKEVSNLFSLSIYERLPFLEIDSEGKEK